MAFAFATWPRVPIVNTSTVATEQCVDSTYLRPRSIHPKRNFNFVLVSNLLPWACDLVLFVVVLSMKYTVLVLFKDTKALMMRELGTLFMVSPTLESYAEH